MEPMNLFLLITVAVIYALIGLLLARDFYLSEYCGQEMTTLEFILTGLIFVVWPLLFFGLLVTIFLTVLDSEVRGKLWKK